jgi:hypothetical protein
LSLIQDAEAGFIPPYEGEEATLPRLRHAEISQVGQKWIGNVVLGYRINKIARRRNWSLGSRVANLPGQKCLYVLNDH